MGYFPSFQELIRGSDPERLLQVQPSLRSIIPNIVYFLISAIIVGVLDYYFYNFQFPQNIPVLKYLSVRWLAIIPAVFLIEIVRRYHNDLYILGTHRLTHLRGRLSLNYSVPVINYVDIRAITVEQDIFARILNYGSILIGTAAEKDNELVIVGVRSPVELASIIDSFRTHSQSLRAAQIAKRGGNTAAGATSE